MPLTKTPQPEQSGLLTGGLTPVDNDYDHDFFTSLAHHLGEPVSTVNAEYVQFCGYFISGFLDVTAKYYYTCYATFVTGNIISLAVGLTTIRSAITAHSEASNGRSIKKPAVSLSHLVPVALVIAGFGVGSFCTGCFFRLASRLMHQRDAAGLTTSRGASTSSRSISLLGMLRKSQPATLSTLAPGSTAPRWSISAVGLSEVILLLVAAALIGFAGGKKDNSSTITPWYEPIALFLVAFQSGSQVATSRILKWDYLTGTTLTANFNDFSSHPLLISSPKAIFTVPAIHNRLFAILSLFSGGVIAALIINRGFHDPSAQLASASLPSAPSSRTLGIMLCITAGMKSGTLLVWALVWERGARPDK